MAVEFVLPEFLETGTDVESIHQWMLNKLPGDIDATEGGFVWDFTRPAANLASELLTFWIPETLKLLFTNTSSGQYLDYLAERANTSRKQATYATVTLVFTGDPATVIPAGTVISTAAVDGNPAVEFATTAALALDVNGTGSVLAQAVEAGPGSNVDADTLILFSSPIIGASGVTNPEPATGGTATESDDDLRERIDSINKSGDSSLVGNVADYKRWAEEVDGVGAATVLAEWNGPQTVKIIVTDANGDGASETIRTAVYNHLMRPDEELKRLTPPDMTLTVAAPELVGITYTATVELLDGHTIAGVAQAFEAALVSFHRAAAAAGEVKYTAVGALLSGIPGVNDFKDLLLNGGTSNIHINLDQFPRTESVTFTAGEVI